MLFDCRYPSIFIVRSIRHPLLGSLSAWPGDYTVLDGAACKDLRRRIKCAAPIPMPTNGIPAAQGTCGSSPYGTVSKYTAFEGAVLLAWPAESSIDSSTRIPVVFVKLPGTLRVSVPTCPLYHEGDDPSGVPPKLVSQPVPGW